MVQVQMLQVFKRKDEQDPTHCVSAIPSQIVQPPVPAEVLADLCCSARYEPDKVAPAVAAGHVHATAVALLHAAHILESDPHAQQLQQDNQVAGGNPRRKYFLKRNYAGIYDTV